MMPCGQGCGNRKNCPGLETRASDVVGKIGLARPLGGRPAGWSRRAGRETADWEVCGTKIRQQLRDAPAGNGRISTRPPGRDSALRCPRHRASGDGTESRPTDNPPRSGRPLGRGRERRSAPSPPPSALVREQCQAAPCWRRCGNFLVPPRNLPPPGLKSYRKNGFPASFFLKNSLPRAGDHDKL
jgi:hypothetical protein